MMTAYAGMTLLRRKARQTVIYPLCVALVAVTSVLVLKHAYAAEMEPRAHVNTPVDVNFLIGGYVYSDGGLSTAGSAPVQDAQLRMSMEVVAYAKSFGLWGNSGKIDIIVPYSELTGRAVAGGKTRWRNVSGLPGPLRSFPGGL